jgi:hypothetical protein
MAVESRFSIYLITLGKYPKWPKKRPKKFKNQLNFERFSLHFSRALLKMLHFWIVFKNAYSSHCIKKYFPLKITNFKMCQKLIFSKKSIYKFPGPHFFFETSQKNPGKNILLFVSLIKGNCSRKGLKI